MDKINELYDEFEKTDNWNERLKLINELNDKIIVEEEIINKKIQSLDDVIKITKKKLNIDELLNEFNDTSELDKKIQIYQNLNSFIIKLNNELFN
jgi:coenzyme F420-reducing hydrogenase delta subunit